MKVFYSPEYVAAAESFDTMRKSGWVVESLVSSPIDNVEIVAPRPLEFGEIAAVHDAAYVTAVRSGMWRSVAASTGGVVAAAIEAMPNGVSGSLSGGLPHARRNRGSGFCTFNGLAIAAKAALARGADSVLIIDVDAHCGGGTHSLIKGDARIRQIVSVDSFDHYEPSGANTLDMVLSADRYLSIIAGRLAEIEDANSKPAICLYNSGMDPDEGCGIGGLLGINEAILREREQIVFQWFSDRQIPIAFVIAGGYVGGALSKEGLVDFHRMTIVKASEIVHRQHS